MGTLVSRSPRYTNPETHLNTQVIQVHMFSGIHVSRIPQVPIIIHVFFFRHLGKIQIHRYVFFSDTSGFSDTLRYSEFSYASQLLRFPQVLRFLRFLQKWSPPILASPFLSKNTRGVCSTNLPQFTSNRTKRTGD